MIHIVTDTTSGLPAGLAQQYDIPVIPQVIMFGDESYLEGVDIDHATFLSRLRTSKTLPKTAAPPPGLFVDMFRARARPGDTVLCIHPSAELSGTVRSALTAAADFPDMDIRVLDTRTIAGPLAALALLAAQWAEQGRSAEAVMAGLQAMIPRAHVYFLVDTLEYLQKGGRIGGAAALIGSVLQVKPILELREGRVEPLERERTQRKGVGPPEGAGAGRRRTRAGVAPVGAARRRAGRRPCPGRRPGAPARRPRWYDHGVDPGHCHPCRARGAGGWFLCAGLTGTVGRPARAVKTGYGHGRETARAVKTVALGVNCRRRSASPAPCPPAGHPCP
jgi:DegV family protein with EDD domain